MKYNNMFQFDKKFKDWIEEKNPTIIGVAWSCYWRLMLILAILWFLFPNIFKIITLIPLLEKTYRAETI